MGDGDVDPALLARALAGDAQAVNELLTLVRPKVARYTRGRLSTYGGGAEMADEVTQDVCLAVARALPRYTEQGAPFWAFVYAVAANKVADVQRRYAPPCAR